MEILGMTLLGIVLGRILVAIKDDRQFRKLAKLLGPAGPMSTEVPTVAEIRRPEWMN